MKDGWEFGSGEPPPWADPASVNQGEGPGSHSDHATVEPAGPPVSEPDRRASNTTTEAAADTSAPVKDSAVGASVVECLKAAAEAVDSAAQMPALSVFDHDLVAAAQIAGRVAASADVVLISLAAEALARGSVEAGGHRLTDWVLRMAPHLARSHALDIARVAHAVTTQDREPGVVPVIAAVMTGELGVRRASMVLRALTRVRPVVDDDTYAKDVTVLLDAAEREVFTETDLRRVTDHLIATAMTAADHAERDRMARAARGVCESSLADGSLTRFIIQADPEGAATIRAVLASPLAAPAPADDGEPDLRSPAQRRYDALIATLARGVASPDGQPTTAKAQVLITMNYGALIAAVTDHAGSDPVAGGTGGLGPGFTATGEMLSPATVRRVACDADLIPAVLGGNAEILELGRARRLFTSGQRRYLAYRDHHCTFGGCTIPASWCDGHHVRHWADGGTTDITNGALLCARHHTYVHEHNLTATIDPGAPPGTAVTWHTPDTTVSPALEPERS